MKPRKKYIREEIIKEIESDIKETEVKLKCQWDALRHACLGKFKTEITDYKTDHWYVDVEFPCKGATFSGNYSEHLFIDKKTGKNKYPKKVAK